MENSNTHDYVSKIIEFNNDPEIIALREKYSEPTFFEVISKDRSETTYSAFLKWMFQDCVPEKNTISPILQLLNILVKRSNEPKKDTDKPIQLIESDLRNACLSGGVKIKDIIVETELGMLTVKGDNLRINKLSIDTSEVIVEGEIISLTYSNKDLDKKNESFLGKIFK